MRERIERVAFGSHLHHQSVQPATLRRVEQTNDLRLLRVERQSLGSKES